MLDRRKVSYVLILLGSNIIILLYPIMQNPVTLQSTMSRLGWLGILLDLVVLALQAFIPVVPFALLAGINAILFGWIGGFVLSLAGGLTGSALGFYLARNLGQSWAEKQLAKWPKLKVSRTPSHSSFLLVLGARLLPVLPSAAVNFLAGLSDMKFFSFFLASLLGKIPMVAWEMLVGHDFWQFSFRPWHFLLILGGGTLIWGALRLTK
ncbi:MAG: TVP38/TMEM64 family protein [Desulfitobacteriaceae bacterium]